MSFFEINSFTKSFGDTEVLKGISFSVEKGEVVSIIGSSGSGKTTLLRCITGLEKPDTGEMKLEGKEIEKTSFVTEDGDYKQVFGLVFQSFFLFPQYNVLKNVTLAPELQIKNKLKAYKKVHKGDGVSFMKLQKELRLLKAEKKLQIKKLALELLARVGLSEKANNYPHELSGGQQQRVAIARALALEPAILCFDEPTSALDPELTREVLSTIQDLKKSGMTMIIVTHEMNFARNVSDHVIYMADGVIEEEGKPEDVFGNPKSDRLKKFLTQE